MKAPRHNTNHFIIAAAAVAVLLLLSLVPWNSLTGGFFKDFNIFEDISIVKTENKGNGEIIDPELLALMESHEDDNDKHSPDSISVTFLPDSAGVFEPADSMAADTVIPNAILPREGEPVGIEDYSADGMSALARFGRAVSASSSRPVRIAMIGDSYIEGDVFSQDIREQLQTLYGGKGASYQMLHSELPGFRQSVVQSDKGWTVRDMRNSSNSGYKWLACEYFKGSSGATSTFRGVRRLKHLDTWDVSTFLFISPADGSVVITTDSGAIEYSVLASEEVQCIRVESKTSKTSVKSNISGLTALGLWLDGYSGISLDCLSLRGNSGISHRKLNADLARQMSAYVPYDLIIVEYGINALSSSQSDYSRYGKYMEEVIGTLRQCYPQADILMLGIGDRGQKSGGQVRSIPTAQNMVNTQRDVARRTGIAFWDTRAAMGGDGSIVQWRERGQVNADYIHLNHKGGRHLAELFVNAIKQAISR